MELQSARQIIDSLARGIHPVTGEMMPEDSPYNAPPVIRALFAVACALDERPPAKPRRELPPNSGQPWTPEEDRLLAERFEAGRPVAELALSAGRSRLAVEARLIKLGMLQPAPGLASKARFVS
ncbi:MAG: hypothetical protein ABW051_03905 [Burkholderiaceae bacterium]